MKLKNLIAGILVVTSIAAYAQNANKVRMAFVGNSITYGAGVDRETQVYSIRLLEKLKPIFGDSIEIYNAGRSGRTLARNSDLPIWNEPQFDEALLFVPDICMIMLGTNDTKPIRWDQWGDEFLDDYMAMIEAFRFRNPDTRFVIAYPPPIGNWRPNDPYEQRQNDSILSQVIAPLLDQVVESIDPVVVDFYNELTVGHLRDGIHPGAEGHEIMAQLIYDSLMKNHTIQSVKRGAAYAKNFRQLTNPAPLGARTKLAWSTFFADSVFLDGVQVELSGTKEVIVEADKEYVLEVHGKENISESILRLDTYEPIETSLKIIPATMDYAQGLPTVLNVEYLDQNRNEMAKNTRDVVWSLDEGNAEFGIQSDTSILIIPIEEGLLRVRATIGDFTIMVPLRVQEEPPLSTTLQDPVRIYPNPAHDSLFISVENLKSTIQIFDLNGRSMIATDRLKKDQEIDTSTWQAGAYICVISSESGITYHKIIKE